MDGSDGERLFLFFFFSSFFSVVLWMAWNIVSLFLSYFIFCLSTLRVSG